MCLRGYNITILLLCVCFVCVCIVAGELSLNTDSGNEQIVRVEAQTIHPNYNSETTANDICVLSLKSSFTYNSNVAPILMDTPTLNIAGSYSSAIVSGWGTNTSGLYVANTYLCVCVCVCLFCVAPFIHICFVLNKKKDTKYGTKNAHTKHKN